MTITRFKRRSINLDDVNHRRCKVLADEMATSISGVLRILIFHAFVDRQDSSQRICIQKQQLHDRSCLPT